MSDIVERLRRIAKELPQTSGNQAWLRPEDTTAWEAADEIEKLRAALRELIYETTHLSPQEDDGSHRCTITGETLRKARAGAGGADMSDIVERDALRAENDKLRSENAKLAASNHAYLSDYQEARGEIEKLRAALEEKE